MPAWCLLLRQAARLHFAREALCRRLQFAPPPKFRTDPPRSLNERDPRPARRWPRVLQSFRDPEPPAWQPLEPLEPRLLMSGDVLTEPDGLVERSWWENPSGDIHVAAFESSPDFANRAPDWRRLATLS